MRFSTAICAIASALMLAVVATPSNAGITAALAKQCRVLMLKAHPTQMFVEHGSAAVQRDYFHECVSRQGNMDGGKTDEERTTTGSGSADHGVTPSGRRW